MRAILAASILTTFILVFASPSYAKTQMEELIGQANRGDAQAQLLLGEHYRWGIYVMPDGSRVQGPIRPGPSGIGVPRGPDVTLSRTTIASVSMLSPRCPSPI